MFNGLSLLIVAVMMAITAVIFYNWGKQDADPITYNEGWDAGYTEAMNIVDNAYVNGAIDKYNWSTLADAFWQEQE